MIGDHIPDSGLFLRSVIYGNQFLEKIQMRPTVERRPGSSFSNLMEQFDESQRIAERRKRHFAEWEGCMNVRSYYCFKVNKFSGSDRQVYESRITTNGS
jgi:hypothetical protein